ncbi:MAG: Fe-S cluster assembly protein SufB, partial [Tissierellales bacterium]
MEERRKTYVEDLDRSIYDIRNEFKYSYKTDKGLTPEIVKDISWRKNEPKWMTEFRLKSLEIYNKLDVPVWGPNLDDLDIENIVTYVRPNTDMKYSWDEVPEDIKKTFERLGIPEAERKSLAGVGAQYDSEVVYHNLKEDMEKQGVIYTDME